MKIIRWIICFPGAMAASLLAWALVEKMFEGVASTYGGGVVRSALGLTPMLVSSAVPTIIFVVCGTLLSPSKDRKMAFVFFGLSLLFSAGGLQLLRFQDFSHIFWLAAAGGIVAGAVLGLGASLSVQVRRQPIQPPQTTPGSSAPLRV